jgi:hypothetical protein
MLFDLRGSGRRATVKAVYITLAVLMGGGLVLFGIGGATSGGLLDAITNNGSSGSTVDTETFQKRADQAQRAAEANPKDAAAWAEVVRARYQLARAGDNFDEGSQQYTAGGIAQLRVAAQAWEKHLALKPKSPDDSVAGLMVNIYTLGLNDAAKAVQAQEIVAEARPKARTYQTLAELAYGAGQIGKGDLAANKAIELADTADKETLKAELKDAKQQAIAQQIQNTATPTPTATPKGGGKKDKKSSSGGKD